jgi:hypothetical protein
MRGDVQSKGHSHHAQLSIPEGNDRQQPCHEHAAVAYLFLASEHNAKRRSFALAEPVRIARARID